MDQELIVGDVTHELKVFDENPAVCEAYETADGKQWHQCGAIHQKLLVQRVLNEHESNKAKQRMLNDQRKKEAK